MADVDFLDPILGYLRTSGGALVRDIAVAVLDETPGLTGRTRGYMRAYRCLRMLEDHGAAKRERLVVEDGAAKPLLLDFWTAVDGAAPHPRAQDGFRRAAPKDAPIVRVPVAPRRQILLTDRMHMLLLGVLNDVCQDEPQDADLRKLRNIVRSSPMAAADGPLPEGWSVEHDAIHLGPLTMAAQIIDGDLHVADIDGGIPVPVLRALLASVSEPALGSDE